MENPNPAVLRRALVCGADAKSCDPAALPAMHGAALREVEFVDVLLEAGVSIHTEDYCGQQAIHRAVHLQNTPMVQFLLNRGANVAAVSTHRDTPVHSWIQSYTEPKCEILELLLRAGADINAVNKGGDNAAHIAFTLGWVSQLVILIDSGIDLECVNSRGMRPWQCCRSGWCNVTEKYTNMLAIIYMSGMHVTRPESLDAMHPSNKHLWHEVLLGYVRPVNDDTRGHAHAIEMFHTGCARIVKTFVPRIMTICMSLQQLRLPALLLCEIIQVVFSCWPRIRFCDIWNRVVAVRHFHERKQRTLSK